MPPKRTTDDQNVKLLLSVLDRVPDLGKLDWTAIAKENDIPTTGAAQMRLRRLKEAYKNTVEGTNAATSTPDTLTSPNKKATASKKQNKRAAGGEADNESPTKKATKDAVTEVAGKTFLYIE
jgi:hypothetical protein